MTHAFCFFCNVGRQVRRGTSLALAPKKSVALQARLESSPDIAPVSSESGASVTASSTGQASPVVVPMPSAGQAVGEAEGEPSEIAEHLALEAISLPTLGRSELPATLIVSTTAGMT